MTKTGGNFFTSSSLATGLVALVLVASWCLAPRAARAEGALAVGIPTDVAKDGFAYGYKVDGKDGNDARNAAFEACRSTTSAPETARSNCVVIGSFRNECVAIAMDPQAGTPGVGAAIAADKQTAELRALAFCEATAGKDRRRFCKVDAVACDGSKN
jgi:hypothetical protein